MQFKILLSFLALCSAAVVIAVPISAESERIDSPEKVDLTKIGDGY
ncbi:hypothetical protein VTN00DRAFT_10240 [Thermoascus crustaceus]